jgi:flagellar motor switch protein FliN/FliY
MTLADNGLIQEWTSALARAIESMTGKSPEIGVQPADRPSGADYFWWEQSFSAAEGAAAWAGASPENWKEIGSSLLKAAGVDDDDEAGFKSTYQEVITQAFSGLAQALSTSLMREVTCTSSRESAPRPTGATYRVDLTLGDNKLSLTAVLSEELMKSQEQPAAKKEDEVAAPAPETTNTNVYPKSLDLLLDVELPVSVSFGRAQLPLKDVIKLTTGSIVELNRAVSEPVEIIVNNCVIARGQVVVVEGNFGVRIQQVVSRQERLRTLR